MPARIPMIAPTRAPMPAEPAAQPMSTPRPMQRTSAARSTPPAPAGSKEEGEVACIGEEIVTANSLQKTRFQRSLYNPGHGPSEHPLRPRQRRQRRLHLG